MIGVNFSYMKTFDAIRKATVCIMKNQEQYPHSARILNLMTIDSFTKFALGVMKTIANTPLNMDIEDKVIQKYISEIQEPTEKDIELAICAWEKHYGRLDESVISSCWEPFGRINVRS